MSENLDRRIAAALADEAVNLAKLFELLQETDAAVSAAVATAEQERQKSLDPALSPDPKAARQGMEDAVFAADRLRAVLPRLQRRYESAAHAQRKAEWVKKYDAVKVEHDAAVAELTQLYPTLVDQLVDLLSRIREVDGRPFPEAGEPDDGRHLPMVECAARSLIGTTIGGQWDTRLSLDRDLVLPDFGAPTKKAWPPHEVPVALQLALAHR